MGNQMRLLLLLLTFTHGSVLWCQLYTFWSGSVNFSMRFLQKICQHAWASTPYWICLPLGKHLDSSHKDIAVSVCFQDLKSGTDKRWSSIVNTDRFIYKDSWLHGIGSGLVFLFFSRDKWHNEVSRMWSGQLFCSCLARTVICLNHSPLDVRVNCSCRGTFERYRMYLFWWALSGWKEWRTGSLRPFMGYTNRATIGQHPPLHKLHVTRTHKSLTIKH